MSRKICVQVLTSKILNDSKHFNLFINGLKTVYRKKKKTIVIIDGSILPRKLKPDFKFAKKLFGKAKIRVKDWELIQNVILIYLQKRLARVNVRYFTLNGNDGNLIVPLKPGDERRNKDLCVRKLNDRILRLILESTYIVIILPRVVIEMHMHNININSLYNKLIQLPALSRKINIRRSNVRV